MDDLIELSRLIKIRNQTEQEISLIINRPALIGHMGEYIASEIFSIQLNRSASEKASDGTFSSGSLKGKSVNIKWYSAKESILDINSDYYPDYFLVFSGSKNSKSSKTRPWNIEYVYLFNSAQLIYELSMNNTKIGIATSVKTKYWYRAEIFPNNNNPEISLTNDQIKKLELFR